MKDVVISEAVKYIGEDDKDLDLFESQYIIQTEYLIILM